MSELRLHANENAWGASASVGRALLGAGPSAYPEGDTLERRLGEVLGVGPERVVLGNGSTELVSLMISGLCGPADGVAFTEGSFVAYPQLARAAGRRLQPAAPRVGGGTDLDALAAVVDGHTRLVFVANPDNPSGTICDQRALDRFLDGLPEPGPLVVLDEAYREYVSHPGFPAATRYLDRPNVALLRTFSKVHGLAGLRCGYLVAPTALAARIRAIGGPYRVGAATRAAATAAQRDVEHVTAVVEATLAARASLCRSLAGLGPIPESHASFVMLHLDRPAAPVAASLAARGIRVCDLGPWGWPRALRLTVGRTHHHPRLAQALADALCSSRTWTP